MSEELDPTTEMLVNELSSRILPPLEKTLSEIKIQPAEFPDKNINENQNNILIENAVKKLSGAIKTSSDETRAGYEVLMRSVSSIREEIYSIKRTNTPDKAEKIDHEPDFERLFNSLNALENSIKDFYNEWRSKNETEQVKEPDNKNLTSGQSQNLNVSNVPDYNLKLDDLLNKALPDLEGVIRSHDKAQTHELESLSNGLRSLQNNNNAALIHEIKKITASEISSIGEKIQNEIKNALEKYQTGLKKLTRIIIITGCISFLLTALIIYLTRI